MTSVTRCEGSLLEAAAKVISLSALAFSIPVGEELPPRLIERQSGKNRTSGPRV